MRGLSDALRRCTGVAVSCVWFCLRELDAAVCRLIGARGGGDAVILAYHGVRADQRDAFAWQMRVLLKAGRSVPLGKVASSDAEGLAVAVTFDDAFANLIGNAFPELVQRGIPATVFVPSGSLGRRPAWRVSEGRRDASDRVMTAEQVRGVASSKLFTVGSHTVEHAMLTELDDGELDHELTMSKVHLEGLTGAPVDSIAFPYGVYDGRVLDHARRAGYTRALSIEPRVYHVGERSFLMGRVRVEPNDWRIEFWLKLRGAYQWLALLQGFRRRWRQPGAGVGGARP